MVLLLPFAASIWNRRGGSGGSGSLGCFVVILAIGLVLYFVLRGRRDKPEALGTAKRAMGSGAIADHTFANPYPKCPTCAASGDKMKQQWDGLRKVTWTCGYCGNVAGIQELKDEELPPSARQHLGLDLPAAQDFPGTFPGQGGGGVGGLLTGMMIGSMLNGDHEHRHDDWGAGGSGNDASDNDWRDAGSGGDDSGSDQGGGDSSGDDSGGADPGGSDW
jgi:hypothetical protein